MKYDVVLTDGAKQQLDEACGWYVNHAPHIADDWYNGFIDALVSLETNPYRHSLARENESFPVEIRQFLYGYGRRITHRAIYSIHSDRVVIRAIRHVAQRDLTPEDVS